MTRSPTASAHTKKKYTSARKVGENERLQPVRTARGRRRIHRTGTRGRRPAPADLLIPSAVCCSSCADRASTPFTRASRRVQQGGPQGAGGNGMRNGSPPARERVKRRGGFTGGRPHLARNASCFLPGIPRFDSL